MIGCLRPLVAGVLLLAPWAGHAGEPLVFSGPRSRPDPSALGKSTKESDVQLKKLAPINPASYIDRGGVNAPRDARTERKLHNARVEEKNWIMLDKGELDAREEERTAFGVKDPTYDPKRDQEDYMLEKADRPDRNGQPRLASTLSRMPSSRFDREKAPAPQNRPTVDLDSMEKERTSTTGNGAMQRSGLGKDMDLRSLLAPGKANSIAPPDRSVASWRDIFGGNEAKRTEGDLALRQESSPAASPDGLQPSSAPISTAPESLKFRPDLTSRRADSLGGGPLSRPEQGMNPMAPPAGSRSSLTPLLPPSAPKAPVVDFSRPQSASGASIQDPFNRSQSGLGPSLPSGPSSPAYGQPDSGPSYPSRPGSAFNTIPTRPGFGR